MKTTSLRLSYILKQKKEEEETRTGFKVSLVYIGISGLSWPHRDTLYREKPHEATERSRKGCRPHFSFPLKSKWNCMGQEMDLEIG